MERQRAGARKTSGSTRRGRRDHRRSGQLQGYTSGVRRPGPALAALFACASAGVLFAFVLAGGVGAQGLATTGTTATEPPPALIPPGVTIGGIAVGGLAPEVATALVQERFDSGLPLVYNGRRRLTPSPYAL